LFLSVSLEPGTLKVQTRRLYLVQCQVPLGQLVLKETGCVLSGRVSQQLQQLLALLCLWWCACLLSVRLWAEHFSTAYIYQYI